MQFLMDVKIHQIGLNSRKGIADDVSFRSRHRHHGRNTEPVAACTHRKDGALKIAGATKRQTITMSVTSTPDAVCPREAGGHGSTGRGQASSAAATQKQQGLIGSLSVCGRL
jgi:hypothetical protein